MDATNLVADTIYRTVELGLTITGTAIDETFTRIDCRPVEHDPACPTCGQPGRLRDHIERPLTDLPVVGHPTRILIRTPRFTCENPGCVTTIFRQRMNSVAAPKAALTRWLTARDQAFRDRVKIVAMDGFAAHHSAAKDVLLQARAVIDPFHVVHLAAEKLTVCRQRIQQVTLGHRGQSGDPLYGIRRALLTRNELRTDKQKARLEAVFVDEEHIDVEVTERVYQDLVSAYADQNRRAGKLAMFEVLTRIKSGDPEGTCRVGEYVNLIQVQ